MSKIAILGGTGILGKELKKIDDSLIVSGSEVDIRNYLLLSKYLIDINPDIIINCVSLKSEVVDKRRIDSIDINIIGAANISKFCLDFDKRLCYISTDYVYSGRRGYYSEDDEVLPHNLYAWTKLAAESCTMLVRNHIIIRTSFGENNFPYKFAYKNVFVSKDYVDRIAPIILESAKSNIQGILNIGTDRKSVYDYANQRNNIEGKDAEFFKDFSLNTEKLKTFKLDV